MAGWIMLNSAVSKAERQKVDAQQEYDAFEEKRRTMTEKDREESLGEFRRLEAARIEAEDNWLETVEAVAIAKYLPWVGLENSTLARVQAIRNETPCQ